MSGRAGGVARGRAERSEGRMHGKQKAHTETQGTEGEGGGVGRAGYNGIERPEHS